VATWAHSVRGKTPVEVVQATADKVCKAAAAALETIETTQFGNGSPEGLDVEARTVSRAAAAVDAASGADVGGPETSEVLAVTGQARPRLAHMQRQDVRNTGPNVAAAPPTR
jgi:hypothetical protein